jgi:exopolyphosphatase/guanosine-5'-triphosphate,3'-diphosphate pyrophosphatase
VTHLVTQRTRPVRRRAATVLAAIDVGTNALRLELARPLGDGEFEILHQERDPIRPGEGVFQKGVMSAEVVERLVATLRRYAATCQRFGATTRAVATSAMREAKNRPDVLRRVRKETGLDLEVISGAEEARLICLGVLSDRPERSRSLVVDIGGGSTEIAIALGHHPQQLFSLDLGAVRLSELFDAQRTVTPKVLKLMRAFAKQILREQLGRDVASGVGVALGSSGTIKSVVNFAGEGPVATAEQLEHAVDELASMDLERRRRRFDARRADIVIAGAVVLEAIVKHLHLPEVRSVDRGLRDGLILDLWQREHGGVDPLSAEAALAYGRRFQFEEAHAKQVARLALTLFDALAPLHRLPASARPLLEVAALLHDIGNAVNYHRHHKHTYYLIQNAEIPGLNDRDRELVARIARFHRRSLPEPGHVGLLGLTATEARLVTKLSLLLRFADAGDRSHRQPVETLSTRLGTKVQVLLTSREPLDLEIWDMSKEAESLRRAIGRPVEVLARAGPGTRGARGGGGRGALEISLRRRPEVR